MICPSCQTSNRDGAKRCRNCGQVLPGAPQHFVPGQPLPPIPPQPIPAYPPQSLQAGTPAPGVPPLPPPPAKASLLGNVTKKQAGLGCLLLLVGFVFGIFGTIVVWSVSGASATPTPATAEKPETGFRPPTFKVSATDGKEVEFPQVLEGKAGVLAFWATDSGNDEQMNKLQALASDKLSVFAVNSKDSQATARKYAEGKGWNKITVLLDGDEAAKEAYQVTEVPTYFLIDKEGKIADKLGNLKAEELEGKVNDELLK